NEWAYIGKSPHTPELVEWTCPNLKKLWLGKAMEDKNRQMRAFLACMRSDTPVMLNPASIPTPLLVLCCVLRMFFLNWSFALRCFCKAWSDSYATEKLKPSESKPSNPAVCFAPCDLCQLLCQLVSLCVSLGPIVCFCFVAAESEWVSCGCFTVYFSSCNDKYPQFIQIFINGYLSPQVDNLDPCGVQLAALFMSGVDMALFANDACGQPVPWEHCCSWMYFDGKVLQSKLIQASREKAQLIDLCDGQVASFTLTQVSSTHSN
ncbi:hypothetical protein GOODEAATRI_032849, partial [Goodea atripinnis]